MSHSRGRILQRAIAAVTVEPAGKTTFVYSCTQRRLMGQYNEKQPISLILQVKISDNCIIITICNFLNTTK